MAFTEDPSAFLDPNGFGVPVTAGAVSGVGILDIKVEMVINGEFQTKDYVLIALTSEFGHLRYGDLVVIDGENYKAELQPQPFDDETFCRVPLVKITEEQKPIIIINGDFA